MKYVRETIDDYKELPIKTLIWEDVEPHISTTSSEYIPDYVNLPFDFKSSMSVHNEREFNEWYKEFTSIYGEEGNLVKYSTTNYKVEGNSIWDNLYKSGSDAIRKYYKEKRPGDYTGD